MIGRMLIENQIVIETFNYILFGILITTLFLASDKFVQYIKRNKNEKINNT